MDARRLKEPTLSDIDWIRTNPTDAARMIFKLRKDVESILTALERSVSSGDTKSTARNIVSI